MARAGFTFLELLTAIALVAILGAIAVPQGVRMLAGWRLAATARQVVMDLKLVRAQAILSSTTQRLRFAAPGATYQQERQRTSGTYEAIAPAIRVPADVQIVGCTAAGSGIGFRPRGNAATFGTVTLRNTAGDKRAVIVDIVGRVRVQ
jgi:prepilin-type N-terminal cleavage/methylation domain-containing protein